MATENAPTAQDKPVSETPTFETPTFETPTPEPAFRRTVTLPVLPLVIVSAAIVAILFFGGGVALGYSIGGHPTRVGNFQPYGGINQGGQGGQGGQNGQNGFGQNGGQRPHERPSGAPKNG